MTILTRVFVERETLTWQRCRIWSKEERLQTGKTPSRL